jgi:curved DNA-binding protein CbpA
VFERYEKLARDLEIASSNNHTIASERWTPEDDQIGAALIGLATDRVPAFMTESYGTVVLGKHRDAARRAIAELFFAPSADHFQILGARATTNHERLRKNYQRLIALVHPDARASEFAPDAASRVNRAYTTLSDEQLRLQYTAALDAERTESVARRAPSAVESHIHGNVDVHEHTRFGRLRSLLPSLRRRASLVAALILSGLGATLALWALMPTAPPVELVESRPRLAFAQSIESASKAAPTMASVDVPAIASQEANKLQSPASSSVQQESQKLPLRLTFQLDSPNRSSRADSQRKSESENIAPILPAETKKSQALDRPLSSVERTIAPQTGVYEIAEQTKNTSIDRPSLQAENVAHDIDSLVAQFTSGFESGSLSSLAATLATNMPGRDSVLSNYERVFKQTKQRSIRLSGVKHTPLNDGRMLSAGVAVVTTVDMNDQQARQRVFIEMEVAKEGGVSRIVRLANYEQK